MQIELGKKTLAVFAAIIGYAMVQGVFYGVWDFNQKPTGMTSFFVWLPTMAVGVALALGAVFGDSD